MKLLIFRKVVWSSSLFEFMKIGLSPVHLCRIGASLNGAEIFLGDNGFSLGSFRGSDPKIQINNIKLFCLTKTILSFVTRSLVRRVTVANVQSMTMSGQLPPYAWSSPHYLSCSFRSLSRSVLLPNIWSCYIERTEFTPLLQKEVWENFCYFCILLLLPVGKPSYQEI